MKSLAITMPFDQARPAVLGEGYNPAHFDRPSLIDERYALAPESIGALLNRDVTWADVCACISPRILTEIEGVSPDDALPVDDVRFDAAWMYDGPWSFPQQGQIALLPSDVLALGAIGETVRGPLDRPPDRR